MGWYVWLKYDFFWSHVYVFEEVNMPCAGVEIGAFMGLVGVVIFGTMKL